MHAMTIPFLTLRAAAAGTVLLGLSVGAGASVIFSTKATLPPPREEVQFNDSELVLNGMMLQGRTNQTDSIIEFTGDEPLFTRGSGQAGIAAEDGGFTSLIIEPQDDLLIFTGIGFNLFATENGSVTITAVTNTGEESETFDIRRNGQNRFVLTLDDDDQFLQSVRFTTTADLSDVRQIRLQNLTVIPEPATLGLLGMGGLLALRRRR